jgi:hypothetical protein
MTADSVHGIVVGSDSIQQRGLLDFLDIPFYTAFYGSTKILMRHKVLAQELALTDGRPLIAAALQAMNGARTVSNVSVIAHHENEEQIGLLAEEYLKKEYRIVRAGRTLGDSIADAASRSPETAFILQPDLPQVDCTAIDAAVRGLLASQGTARVCFPVIDSEYFERYAMGWSRPKFPEYHASAETKRLKMLDCVLVESQTINSSFIDKFYNMRTLLSLKGQVNAVRAFPKAYGSLLAAFFRQQLSVERLESVISENYRHDAKIVHIIDPACAPLMRDIDTRADYQAYLLAERRRQEATTTADRVMRER